MATSSDHLAASVDPFLHYSSDYLYPTLNDSKYIFSNDDFNLLQSQPVQEDLLQYQNLNLNQSLSPFSSSDLQQQQFHHKQTTTTTNPTPTPTPSASDPETSTTPKRRTTTTSFNSKPRITKRKSRAAKKNQTTFITADPANFRQMVQQVTGIRFDNNSSTTSSTFPSSLTNLLRPETRRPVGRSYNACLSTLDTSSFLVDQSQSLIGDRLGYGVGGGLGSVGVGAQTVNGESGGYGGGASDGFVSFPTLESWKVM